jgi:hypothetical protein
VEIWKAQTHDDTARKLKVGALKKEKWGGTCTRVMTRGNFWMEAKANRNKRMVRRMQNRRIGRR